jgi:two-component system LytT family response regulator
MTLNNANTIRTLVVDDEPLARQRVVSLLKNYPEIQLVGECRNGEEAVEAINSKKPDLIFLDIEMPGMDGFGVVSNIDLKYKPFIIFATAYNQYALKAFNIHAIDYLLKPFDDERFDEALEIAKQQIKLKNSLNFNDKLLQLISEFNTTPEKYIRQFKIKLRGREKFVKTEDLHYIEAEGNYLMLHHENGRDLFRSTMAAVEKELNPNRFLRIHRSYFVNTVYVKNIRYISNNEYKVNLKNGKEIVSGRSYKEAIKSFLSLTEAP